MKKTALRLVILCCLIPMSTFGKEEEHSNKEYYYILQKGFIKVAGKTNFFDFSGSARKLEGQLIESAGSYTGKLLLRFSELTFNLPMVEEVLQEKDYLNTTVYPIISIELDHFQPSSQPTEVHGDIEMHGVKKEITIATHFEYMPPVVKVTGQFKLAQSDFNVKPYRTGLMKVRDDLDIQFKVFFCESYKENFSHKISPKMAVKLAEEYKIDVLMEKGFFGCAEIKNKKRTP